MSTKRPAPRDNASDVAKKLVDVLQTRRQSVYCTSSNAAVGGDNGRIVLMCLSASVIFSSYLSSWKVRLCKAVASCRAPRGERSNLKFLVSFNTCVDEGSIGPYKTVTNAKAKVRFSLNVKLFRAVGNTPYWFWFAI